MNAHTPFDAKQDWTNPYCQNSSNDPMVDALLGNAYHVVRTVYCNLGNLKLIYDFLNQYGMVLGVQSEAELKALTTKAKYARIYGFSRAGDRQVTDYLYVEGDRTGIIPDNPEATGSWITVATSGSSGGGTSSGEGAYIPWVYSNGSATGGETTISVPDGTVGVPFIIVNGDMQYVGRGFEFNVDSLSITLAQPLEEGDEVVFLLTGVPAVPDNPNVNDWIQINWLYNNGAAVGGEQVIAIPYTFQSVPAVYKNGLRLYKGLTTESYTADPDNQRIFLTEPLTTNDRLIVQLGGEARVLEAADHTLQEVARAANVKDSDVILSTDTTQFLNDKKVVYSVSEQKAYGLPSLPTNVYIQSVENGKLTYSPGAVEVDLVPIPGSSEELKNSLISDTGAAIVSTSSGATVQAELDNITEKLGDSYPNIRGNINTPATGYVFQPYTRYYGDHDIRYIGGGNPKSTKRFKKDGHETITLTGISTTTSNPPTITVDTVAYVNPASADPDDRTFPASITFNGLAFVGDDDETGEVGLTILQGQNLQIQDCGFSKTKLATWFVDVWMTSVSNSSFFGQVRHDGGTSCFYTNCYATVHDASVPLGAYRISNIQYGNMTSCASDGTINGAYWFNGNNGLTVNNCGSEVPTTMDRNYGTAAHFEKSNEMVLTNFYTLPAEGTNMLISVKDDNELVFNNMMVYGSPDRYSRDFWFTGTNNNLIINGGIFGNRGDFPRIATDQPGNTVIYNAVNGNSYIWKTKTAAITAVWEPKFLSQVLDTTSDVVFTNSGPVTGGTRDIKFTKNGNTATVEFDITIPSVSGAVGQLRINGLPYAAAQQASGSVAIAIGLGTGVGNISCAVIRNGTEILFYKSTTAGGVSSALVPSDLTDGCSLRGSITYSCVSDWD